MDEQEESRRRRARRRAAELAACEPAAARIGHQPELDAIRARNFRSRERLLFLGQMKARLDRFQGRRPQALKQVEAQMQTAWTRTNYGKKDSTKGKLGDT